LHRFNLIVSSSRFREEEAQDEIMDLLEMFGDSDSESEITEIRGIIVAQTALDPFDVVDKLKGLVDIEPWQLRYVLRVLPIEVVVPTDIGSIKGATKELASSIGSGDKFRVTVEKRHSPLASMEIINAIAGEIDSKVDLVDPDWVVLVEIIGVQTGISVLEPDQIFSSIVEKRDK
jgi:tRNA acetyltransferase TAN1